MIRTTPDAMLYFIQCDFGKLGLAWLERSDTSRTALIRDILSGEVQDVTAILECNPVEHVCSDVTADILAIAQREVEAQPINREEWRADHERDLRKVPA